MVAMRTSSSDYEQDTDVMDVSSYLYDNVFNPGEINDSDSENEVDLEEDVKVSLRWLFSLFTSIRCVMEHFPKRLFDNFEDN